MLKYAFLGIIQGLTEFLPVSSSGHLVIIQRLFGITENQVAVSVVLHLGTALALLVFLRKDIWKALADRKLLTQLLTVTVITGAIGVLAKGFFESLFGATTPVAIALIITGAILIFTKKFTLGKRNNLNFKDAVILGFTQAVAIIPGISRSGITISTLLFRGIDREQSFRFSFLAAIPIIFGAAILEARDINFAARLGIQNLLAGFALSFLCGLLAIRFLKIALEKARLHYFGYYCLAVSAAVLLFLR
jgi:undecaprenyl-diphosphatase